MIDKVPLNGFIVLIPGYKKHGTIHGTYGFAMVEKMCFRWEAWKSVSWLRRWLVDDPDNIPFLPLANVLSKGVRVKSLAESW